MSYKAFISHEVANWKTEKRFAYLYRVIADSESGTPRQLLFLELAKEADGQATLWQYELKKSGTPVPGAYHPDLSVSILAWLIRKLGPRSVKLLLSALKLHGLSVYSGWQPEDISPSPMPDEENPQPHNHALAELRIALFGLNDGLMSIGCLLAGLAGAYSENSIILLVGAGGVLAASISLAAGEYVTASSKRKMLSQPHTLKINDRIYPAKETAELATIYRAHGMSELEAQAQARRMISDPEIGQVSQALDGLVLNQQEAGSPWIAALLSFFAFVAGGVIPLSPYLLDVRRYPLLISIVVTSFALFGVGAALSRFTGRGALWGGLRMLLIYAAAGGVANLIGNFLGGGIG